MASKFVIILLICCVVSANFQIEKLYDDEYDQECTDEDKNYDCSYDSECEPSEYCGEFKDPENPWLKVRKCVCNHGFTKNQESLTCDDIDESLWLLWARFFQLYVRKQTQKTVSQIFAT